MGLTRVWWLLLAACITLSEGCMPGYEGERDRLREHLGIEWIPGGLKESSWSDKPIRHSSDLNCDFSEPETCKWKNMDENKNLDSRDFYLFEKTDFNEFPALRIGPGPTKMQHGNKMIFTGDKLREEQHSIFYSSPIKCQNSTGNLTFTYWLYNSARVEVLLLEDDNNNNGGYKMVVDNPAEDKPYLDCGTIHLNTECHALIPPRDRPFRLAIRAYNMDNTDGSFVMIDNILYSSSLCNVGIDTGDEFDSTSMMTGANGQAIEHAPQLECNEFDANCRWRSGGDAGTLWRKSSSELPRGMLLNATGSAIAPKGTYAFLYIEQDTKSTKSLDVLRSDPIPCQSQTENELSFRYWRIGEVELEACAVDMMMNEIECVAIPPAVSPAFVKATFRKAAKNFMLTIRVSKFNDDFDNMVIVDEISYKATLCTDALSVFDLGQHFVTTPLLSILLDRNVQAASDLSCDFSKRASSCMWALAQEDTENDVDIATSTWVIGHGPLNSEKMYSLTGLTVLPEGDFGVVKFETGGQTILLSEVVKCTRESVSVQMKVWTTGSAMLKICLVEVSSTTLLDCQEVQKGTIVVDLPAIKKPFRVALHAQAADQGMVIVDDIVVQGELCTSAARQYSSKTYKPRAEIPDVNVCRLLSCDFHAGHTCLYESSDVDHSSKHFVHNQQMMAYLTRSRRVFIFESVPFVLNTVARLHFNYKLQGDVILFICNDSGSNELESCFKVEGREGDDYIELIASDTKVYMIVRLADNGTSGSVQVNRLWFTDTEDQQIC